jgi:hypothetical protein
MMFAIINYDACISMFFLRKNFPNNPTIKKLNFLHSFCGGNKRYNYITMSLTNIPKKDLDNFFEKLENDNSDNESDRDSDRDSDRGSIKSSSSWSTWSSWGTSKKKERNNTSELDELFDSLCKISKEEVKETKEIKETKETKETKSVKPVDKKVVKVDKKIMEIDSNEKPLFTPNEYSHYTGPFGTKAKFDSPEKEYEWAKTQSKECNKCKEELPLSEFGYNTSGKDPFDRNGYRLRRGDCKECNKMANKGKNEAMKVAKESGIPYKAPEGTPCALCNKKKNNLVFDHNHQTNRFRGYLCNECNRSIGMLGENMENMVKILNYINKDEKKNLYWNAVTNQLEIIS